MTRETATINSQGQQATITQDLTLEVRKRQLLTELYKTGRLGGESFGRGTAKNPIKTYIAGCMYKQKLTQSPELIDDCYNETFKHLQEMDAAKVCALYDTAPAKLFATALRIVALKCFAIDPRYANPKHSLIQLLVHTSSFCYGYAIEPCDVDRQDTNDTYNNPYALGRQGHSRVSGTIGFIPVDVQLVEDFELLHGCSIEQVLESLTTDEVKTFYEMAGTQPRGKTSAANLAKRDALVERLKTLLAPGNIRNRVAMIRRERKFKGSIYETN